MISLYCYYRIVLWTVMSDCWRCWLTNFELGLCLTVFESIDIEMLMPALGGKSFSLDSFLNIDCDWRFWDQKRLTWVECLWMVIRPKFYLPALFPLCNSQIPLLGFTHSSCSATRETAATSYRQGFALFRMWFWQKLSTSVGVDGCHILEKKSFTQTPNL